MPSTRVVYVVGPPGVGKSTAVLSAIKGSGLTPLPLETFAPQVKGHRLLDESDGVTRGVYLGEMREQFPGTDSLGMGASPRAVEFLRRSRIPLVIGEGARLGTGKFLGEVSGFSEVTLIHLTARMGVLESRRAKRGSEQSDTWARGAATRASKAFKAAGDLGLRAMELDTSEMSPREVSDFIAGLLL